MEEIGRLPSTAVAEASRLIHMASNNLSAACIAAAAIGVLAHVVYFVRGHLNPRAFRIFAVHVGVLFGLLVHSSLYLGVLRGVIVATVLFSSYLAALFSSIVVYRLYFHPLCRFPGDLGPKVSSMYNGYYNSGGGVHSRLEDAHKKHGDFVRWGELPFHTPPAY